MNDYEKQIENVVKVAIKKFNKKERYLITNQLHEVCICARLAMYLQRKIKRTNGFKEYEVDVEYNKGYDGYDDQSKRVAGGLARLDIIVHKRGKIELIGYDNLICIEMKKEIDTTEYQEDIERLEILTHPEEGFYYKLGFMIITDLSKRKLEIKETFIGGNKII